MRASFTSCSADSWADQQNSVTKVLKYLVEKGSSGLWGYIRAEIRLHTGRLCLVIGNRQATSEGNWLHSEEAGWLLLRTSFFSFLFVRMFLNHLSFSFYFTIAYCFVFHIKHNENSHKIPMKYIFISGCNGTKYGKIQVV